MDEIQSLKAEIARLKELAYKDELTALYNRRAFNDLAVRFLETVRDSGEHQRESVIVKSFSVALFDLDNFKRLNDTYGHQVGDMALKAFAKVVTENIRDIDIATRWGGEEVLVGLVGANEDDAEKIAERIRKDTEDILLQDNGQNISFTVSCGVAGFKKDRDVEQMVELADKALYEAKESGKNRIVKAT